MKKQKLLSLVLALVLCLSCWFAVAISASAEEPAMPTVLPDGAKIDYSKVWLDWSALGLNDANHEITQDGWLKISKAGQSWSGTGNNLLPEPTAWRGASGIMFQVDASSADSINFAVAMLSDGSRSRSDAGTGYAQLNTVPLPDLTGHAFYYANNQWNEVTTSASGQLVADKSASGWWYVPFSSIWYKGGSCKLGTFDEAYGDTFPEFMSNFEKARIIRMAFYSGVLNQLFGDVHLVYTDIAGLPADTTSANLFGTLTSSALEGTAASIVNGNAVTVSGMTGNSGTDSSSRAWVNGFSDADLKNALGLRFYVDTTALDAGAALQLRLRLMSNTKVASASQIYKNGDGYMVSNTEWPNPQYTCRADNSTAYYYVDGVAHAIHPQTNVSTQKEGDLFEALPAGYQGYIYIPFESFWMSGTSYSNLNLDLPFSLAIQNYPLSQIAICHAISGTTTSDSVTYSNFEVVYANSTEPGGEGEGDGDVTTESQTTTTEKPEDKTTPVTSDNTAAPEQKTTDAPEKKGCSSAVVGFGTILALCTIGSGAVLLRKKED